MDEKNKANIYSLVWDYLIEMEPKVKSTIQDLIVKPNINASVIDITYIYSDVDENGEEVDYYVSSFILLIDLIAFINNKINNNE